MLEETKLFLERYKSHHSEFQQLLIDNFIKKGTFFFNQYSLINESHNQENLKNSHSYNIFEILKFKRPEEDLHSQFLSDLLNPKGKHGQKELFYDEFIKMLTKDKASILQFTNTNHLDYQINTEAFIKTNRGRKGRIDIQIKSLNPLKPFIILIENKWDSPDSGFDQIAKYYDSKLEEGYLPSQILLIYLTKKGGDPNIKYLSPKFRAQLDKMRNKNYFALKFSTNVKLWLQVSLSKCQSNNFNFILNQYINIL